MNRRIRELAPRWTMILFAVAAVYALLLCRVEADEAKKPAPDDPVPAEIKVIPLKNVVAADLTRTLEEIFSKKSNIRFALDETANAVIVRAPAAEMAEIQDLIKQVDTPRPENQAPRLELRIYDLRSLEPDKALEHSLRLLFVKSGNFSIDMDLSPFNVKIYSHGVRRLLARYTGPAAASLVTAAEYRGSGNIFNRGTGSSSSFLKTHSNRARITIHSSFSWGTGLRSPVRE